MEEYLPIKPELKLNPIVLTMMMIQVPNTSPSSLPQPNKNIPKEEVLDPSESLPWLQVLTPKDIPISTTQTPQDHSPSGKPTHAEEIQSKCANIWKSTTKATCQQKIH